MASRTVVLLSGGVDSTTVLAIAKAEGFEPYALSFRYGQRHEVELAAARRVAEALGVAGHVVVDVDLRQFGGSSLTSDMPVPKHESVAAHDDGVPNTYVPARNTVFLAIALAYCETIGASDIFVGVNEVDYSGYPDCRPEYIAAFEAMANLATDAAVNHGHSLTIHAPLMHMGKNAIISRGVELGVDYALTHSCYDPDAGGSSCGRCPSCVIRLDGFERAGLVDPISYAEPRLT